MRLPVRPTKPSVATRSIGAFSLGLHVSHSRPPPECYLHRTQSSDVHLPNSTRSLSLADLAFLIRRTVSPLPRGSRVVRRTVAALPASVPASTPWRRPECLTADER